MQKLSWLKQQHQMDTAVEERIQRDHQQIRETRSKLKLLTIPLQCFHSVQGILQPEMVWKPLEGDLEVYNVGECGAGLSWPG